MPRVVVGAEWRRTKVNCSEPATSFGVGADCPTARQSCATTRIPASTSSGIVPAHMPMLQKAPLNRTTAGPSSGPWTSW